MAATAPAAAPTPAVQREGGGLGQFASTVVGTAAGSAMGYVLGNTIGRMLTGGSTSEAAASQTVAAAEPSAYVPSRSVAPQCQEFSRMLQQCMEQNGNQVSICQDYLEMMKACQQQHA